MVKMNFQTLNAPTGGTVSALAVASGELAACFAGTGVGILRSTGGGSWELIPGSPLGVISLTVLPTLDDNPVIFAGTINGIFTSTDLGEIWQACRLPIPGSTILSLGCAPDGNLIMAGSLQDGIFTSRDRGHSWDSRNFGLLDQTIFSVAFSPNFSQDGTVYAGAENAVYFSYNQARAWKELPFPAEALPVLSLAVAPGISSSMPVFAGSEADGLYRSLDRGQNWSKVALPANTVNNLLFIAPTVLAAATERGLFRSTDLGENWTCLVDQADLLCLAATPESLLTGWVESGVKEMQIVSSLITTGDSLSELADREAFTNSLITDPPGSAWLASTRQFSARAFTGLVISHDDPQNRPIALFSQADGLWYSLKPGAEWDCLNPFLPFEDINQVVFTPGITSPNHLVVATGQGLWLGKDGGLDWQCLRSEPISLVCYSPDGKLIFGYFQSLGLNYSTDSGVSWQAVEGPWQNYGRILSLAVGARHHLHLTYSMGLEEEITFWQGIPGSLEEVFRVPGSGNPVVSTWIPPESLPDRPWYASLGSQVWKLSARHAGTRTHSSVIPASEPSETIISLAGKLVGSKTTLYACTSRRLYASTDDARSWTPIHDFYPAQAIALVQGNSGYYGLLRGGGLISFKL